MSDESRGGTFLLGFVLGGLLGAAAGLLLAPQPGSETRSRLVEKGSELFSGTEGVGARARESAESLIARGRAGFEETLEFVRQAVSEGRAEAERTSAELREQLERVRRSSQPAGEA